MAVNPNEDTEFNDALRKHGILPPRSPSPHTPSPPASQTLDQDLTADELRELGEDVTDEDLLRTVDTLYRQRLVEDHKAVKRARFGRVYPISREDYTREVTEASKINEEGDETESGTGVICFLFKDGIPHSNRTFNHVRELAARYPRTKFVSIVGNKCIENLPDSRIPMLIIYRKGEIRNQLVAWGGDRERRLEELETMLTLSGAIDPPDHSPQMGYDRRNSSDEEDSDPSSHMRSATTGTNTRAPKNIRGPPRKDSSDSEFEFDM